MQKAVNSTSAAFNERRFSFSNTWWWLVPVVLAALMVLAPIALIASAWLQPTSDVWQHLADTVLWSLVKNTLVLVVGVGVTVTVLGVSLAWFVSMCEFPGRKVLEWLLMMPMAMPAYVLAFVFLGLTDFSGPLFGAAKAMFGISAKEWPSMRDTWAVVWVLSLVLYPYVYLMSRAAFLEQGRSTFDAARNLGLNPVQAFFRVSLPMARPAVAAGVSLALMETLADFGTVAIFNYDTFTTAIYKAWFSLFNLQAAAQLASLLLLFAALGLGVERYYRGKAKYYEGGRAGRAERLELSPLKRWLVTAFAITIVLGAFIVPFIQLVAWVVEEAHVDWDSRYFDLLWHTVALGVMAALAAVVISIVLSLAKRHLKNGFANSGVFLSTLGYALPGSVLAVGIMLMFTGVDNFLIDNFGFDRGQILAGSVFGLVCAYVIRFLAVGNGAVDAAFERIRPSIIESARSLGERGWGLLIRIYVPMLRSGIVTGVLLVLVDVMKEMPATLLLRPFGWDTLAVRIYELTSEGEWERAALPAVTLVLAGVIPVIVLVRQTRRKRS